MSEKKAEAKLALQAEGEMKKEVKEGVKKEEVKKEAQRVVMKRPGAQASFARMKLVQGHADIWTLVIFKTPKDKVFLHLIIYKNDALYIFYCLYFV